MIVRPVAAAIVVCAGCLVARAACLTPTPAEVAAAMGLGPSVLAAAGVSTSQAQGMLTAISQAESEQQQLESAQAQQSTAVRLLASLRDQLRQLPGDADLLSQLPAAVSGVATSAGAVASAEDALVSAAEAGLSGALCGKITTCRAARKRLAPAEFWVVGRTESEWNSLQAALNAERRCARTGQDLPGEYSSLLVSARENSDVIASRLALDSSLAGITALFQP